MNVYTLVDLIYIGMFGVGLGVAASVGAAALTERKVVKTMQYRDPYTGEYKCPECGAWIDHPGICNACQRRIDYEIEKALLKEER